MSVNNVWNSRPAGQQRETSDRTTVEALVEDFIAVVDAARSKP
jgi:hypothetical protein